ncbi:MAG: hypothetical protein WCP79_06145 [Bacillota bacterium]
MKNKTIITLLLVLLCVSTITTAASYEKVYVLPNAETVAGLATIYNGYDTTPGVPSMLNSQYEDRLSRETVMTALTAHQKTLFYNAMVYTAYANYLNYATVTVSDPNFSQGWSSFAAAVAMSSAQGITTTDKIPLDYGNSLLPKKVLVGTYTAPAGISENSNNPITNYVVAFPDISQNMTALVAVLAGSNPAANPDYEGLTPFFANSTVKVNSFANKNTSVFIQSAKMQAIIKNLKANPDSQISISGYSYGGMMATVLGAALISGEYNVNPNQVTVVGIGDLAAGDDPITGVGFAKYYNSTKKLNMYRILRFDDKLSKMTGWIPFMSYHFGQVWLQSPTAPQANPAGQNPYTVHLFSNYADFINTTCAPVGQALKY